MANFWNEILKSVENYSSWGHISWLQIWCSFYQSISSDDRPYPSLYLKKRTEGVSQLSLIAGSAHFSTVPAYFRTKFNKVLHN